MTSGRFATTTPLTVRTLCILGIAAAIVVGCAPEPAPTPTPTPAFASEEEAFAAAEEVYRAYNDALNARFLGQSEPDPQVFLTALALEADIDDQNQLDEWKLLTTGETAVKSFRGSDIHFDGSDVVITGHACIDVSKFRVLDATGQDVTPLERGDTVAQTVTFVGGATKLLIAEEVSAETSSC